MNERFDFLISKEVERRMHENFLEWEEEYKRKKIDSMKD